MYCKTRKIYRQIIFTIFTDERNQWKLNAANFNNDIEEGYHWLVKIGLAKTFGLANQWKFVSAEISSFTVLG